ncbi:hypothetical protein [Dyella acidisoli]|nr:hypothetical protein [Dyella acidisoli]
MKSLFVGLTLFGLALCVNASGTSDTKMPQYARSFAPPIPMCPPGEHAVWVNGKWECVPIG